MLDEIFAIEFHALPFGLREKMERPMSSRLIEFKNREGLLLKGSLDLPLGPPPRAYALFAHCFTCGKDLKSAIFIARALTQKGIAVLRFDFTGLGESEGDFSATTFSSDE